MNSVTPNEWAFFGRMAPLRQEDGAPIDLGAQLPPGPDTVFVIIRGFAFTPAQEWHRIGIRSRLDQL